LLSEGRVKKVSVCLKRNCEGFSVGDAFLERTGTLSNVFVASELLFYCAYKANYVYIKNINKVFSIA
jgi:hypothetical protein